MPGERMPQGNKGIIGYLRALQEFDKQFPGFEHEIQGVNVDENGDFWVRAIVEEERDGQSLPGHITFKRQVSGIKRAASRRGKNNTVGSPAIRRQYYRIAEGNVMAEQSSDVKIVTIAPEDISWGLYPSSLLSLAPCWEAAFSVCRKTRRPLLH